MVEETSYFSHRRSALVALVAGSNQTILELGCATGTVAEQLVERGTASAVDGVELDPAAAAAAATRMRRVYCADLNTFDMGALQSSYDVLIAADVLEHLIDPWGVLRGAVARVRAGGQVVASLPNIRYIKVVAALALHGEFQYVPEGVLDRTHLRFFTRKSITELFDGAGLHQIEVMRANSGRNGLKRLASMALGDFGHPQFYVTALKP